MDRTLLLERLPQQAGHAGASFQLSAGAAQEERCLVVKVNALNLMGIKWRRLGGGL